MLLAIYSAGMWHAAVAEFDGVLLMIGRRRCSGWKHHCIKWKNAFLTLVVTLYVGRHVIQDGLYQNMLRLSFSCWSLIGVFSILY